ncbi:MAG TPA: response regulator [Leptolyngbyaceae cyanobacterium M33_DOE_097]|nr:response regulator [Leptolyngbyaceae cyanobacterium M33_DOE_097]
MKILLVEDDQSTSEFLRVSLTACRYTVDVVNDGQIALEMVDQFSYDLIILDVIIPRIDGISVCRQLRNKGCKTPILFLTAKSLNEEMIAGLDAGADDYLSKPFDLAQLLARIRALLRRTETVTSPVLTWEELCLDPNMTQVTYKQEEVRLSPQEYRLLELFLRNPLRVFSRNDIIDHLWTIDDLPTEAAVTNLIKDLRKRLKKAGLDQEMIQTVYGLGYRLKSAPQEEFADKQGRSTKTTHIEETDPRGVEAIAQVSKWFQASLEQRLELLEAVEQALKNQTITPEQQQQAREQAHKFVGGLGTFGYRAGSEIAREIERLLQASTVFDNEQVTRFSELLTKLKQEIEKPAACLSMPAAQPLLPLIWVVGSNNLFSITIQQVATVRGFRVKIVAPLAAVEQQLQPSDRPSVILFYNDPEFSQDAQVQQLQTLKTQFPKVPVLTVAEQDSLEDRRTFARAGSDRYILAVAPMDEVFETIAQVLPQTATFGFMATFGDPVNCSKVRPSIEFNLPARIGGLVAPTPLDRTFDA